MADLDHRRGLAAPTGLDGASRANSSLDSGGAGKPSAPPHSIRPASSGGGGGLLARAREAVAVIARSPSKGSPPKVTAAAGCASPVGGVPPSRSGPLSSLRRTPSKPAASRSPVPGRAVLKPSAGPRTAGGSAGGDAAGRASPPSPRSLRLPPSTLTSAATTRPAAPPSSHPSSDAAGCSPSSGAVDGGGASRPRPGSAAFAAEKVRGRDRASASAGGPGGAGGAAAKLAQPVSGPVSGPVAEPREARGGAKVPPPSAADASRWSDAHGVTTAKGGGLPDAVPSRGGPTEGVVRGYIGNKLDGTMTSDESADIAAGYTYMPLNENYPGLRLVHERPPIFVCDDFLSDEETATLVRVAGPLLQRSKTHAAAGSEATKGRTSLTCHLNKKTQPCPMLLKKIQDLTNKPYGHMELPQVARYASSQRYVEHYDGVDPHTDAGKSFCAAGGQRVATVLVYLNHVPDGGATRFKRLNFQVKPKKGAALIFFPGFMNGELDTDALHAGMPAVDTKWVSQVWIRSSFREDGQPSNPVPIEEQSLVGPLHEGIYKGLCIAGNDVHEAIATFDQAKAIAASLPNCQGFTYEHAERYPTTPTRVWFKSKLNVLYNEGWWSYSTGKGM